MSKRKAPASPTAPTPAKVNFDLLQDGERLSRCVYYQVQRVDRDRETVVIKNQDGLSIEMNRRVIEDEMYSARQVQHVVKTARGNVVQQLMQAGNNIFTVEFHKQLRPQDVAQELKLSLGLLGDMPDAQFKKFCRALLEGEERVMTGHLVSTEPTLGRSKVFDLDLGEERLVDHRTLKSIIIRGIKYHV